MYFENLKIRTKAQLILHFINSTFLITSPQDVAVILLTNNWLRHYRASGLALPGNTSRIIGTLISIQGHFHLIHCPLQVFNCLRLYITGNLQVFCLPSALFVSRQQQHYAAYQRNTAYNRGQGKSTCLLSRYFNWTKVDDFLSGGVGYALVSKGHDPQNNENNTYCFHLIFPFSYLFKDIYLASRN